MGSIVEYDIYKMERAFKDKEDRISNLSKNLFYSNMNDEILLKGIFSNKRKGLGRYLIEVKEPWANFYRSKGGDINELIFLLSSKLFFRVKSIHGPQLTEESYGDLVKTIDDKFVEKVTNYLLSNTGLVVRSPEVSWIPWGSEFMYPLRCD